MTVELLHRNFMIELDKLSLSSYPSFLKAEIDYWINQAIEVFVKTRYSGTNTRLKAFQQDQKRTDDLRTLVRTISYQKPDDGPPQNDFNPIIQDIDHSYVIYPEDYMVSLGESVFLNFGDSLCWRNNSCDSGNQSPLVRSDVMEATIENLDSKLSNELSDHRMNVTGKVRPIRVHSDNKIMLFTDGKYSVDRYDLTYLANPPKIKWDNSNLDNNRITLTVMPEHTWSEILSLSVLFALESISESRYQTYAGRAQSIE